MMEESTTKIEKRKKNNEEKESPKKSQKDHLLKEQPSKKHKSNNQEDAKERTPLKRPFTVSVAISGTIIAHAQSSELQTHLVGQIARAMTLFKVDEVIVLAETGTSKQGLDGTFEGTKSKRFDPNIFFARLLQYLETPPYLRKLLFPIHSDLKYAGLLNSLDAPHHVKAEDDVPFREGVVLNRPQKQGKGSWVNVGLKQDVLISHNLQPGVRVTVHMDKKLAKGTPYKAVSPRTPVERGLYWGYTTRLASGLSEVFSQSPYKGGYDFTVAISEKGSDFRSSDVLTKLRNADSSENKNEKLRHLLICFGGPGGIESAVESDERIVESDIKSVFTLHLNPFTNIGARSVRTEEAILITLGAMELL